MHKINVFTKKSQQNQFSDTGKVCRMDVMIEVSNEPTVLKLVYKAMEIVFYERIFPGRANILVLDLVKFKVSSKSF